MVRGFSFLGSTLFIVGGSQHCQPLHTHRLYQLLPRHRAELTYMWRELVTVLLLLAALWLGLLRRKQPLSEVCGGPPLGVRTRLLGFKV